MAGNEEGYTPAFGQALRLVQLVREGAVNAETAAAGLSQRGYAMEPLIYQALLDEAAYYQSLPSQDNPAGGFMYFAERYHRSREGAQAFLGAVAAHFALTEVQTYALKFFLVRDTLAAMYGLEGARLHMGEGFAAYDEPSRELFAPAGAADGS